MINLHVYPHPLLLLRPSPSSLCANPRIDTMISTKLKHLSPVANDVVTRSALRLGTSEDKLVEEFEATSSSSSSSWIVDNSKGDSDSHEAPLTSYSRKLMEFCSSKALTDICQNLVEEIKNGSFSRFTFDMMLAWQVPSSSDQDSYTECVAKEKEEKKVPTQVPPEQDEIPLFYSDLMPLLVDNEPAVREDAFVWLASLVPLVVDIVNARFTFETLTAPSAYRLHYPAYDKFLKETDKQIRYLQKQTPPKGVELEDDEFILHVEGTAGTQRVARHIGATTWPGRLTLTNYSLYFEASGVITYEDAIKIDLSKDIEHSVKPASTGPWGAPLFDKAIVYESSELSEGVVLEFPEITSSTRRDHWLALIKEIMLLHRFLSKFKVECPFQKWEMHSRTILGIIRLHAARELLRISPHSPTKFLIFALCDEIPKGDYVLEELSESLKKVNCSHPCSATSILRTMNRGQVNIPPVEIKAVSEEINGRGEAHPSLEMAVNQAKEEEKEVAIAKATAEELKEEGISKSAAVLIELLKPLKGVLSWFNEVLSWERPATTVSFLAAALIITYKEWVGKALAGLLLWVVVKMLQARKQRINEKCKEIVVSTSSNQSTIESIVTAQQGLQTVHEMIQTANVAVLKMWSIFISKARKHADMVIVVLSGSVIILALIPTKYIIMGVILYTFMMTSKIGKRMMGNMERGVEKGDRRLKEWWDSIPVIHVRVENS